MLFKLGFDDIAVSDLSCAEIDEFEVSSLIEHEIFGLYGEGGTLRSRWVTPLLCMYSSILTISPM